MATPKNKGNTRPGAPKKNQPKPSISQNRYERTRNRNADILTDAGIPRDKYPSRWQMWGKGAIEKWSESFKRNTESVNRRGVPAEELPKGWETFDKSQLDKAIKSYRNREQYRKTKERNARAFERAGIDPKDRPKDWQRMSEKKLTEQTGISTGDVWLYIGWGDNSKNQTTKDFFARENQYGQQTEDENRKAIRDKYNSPKTTAGGSSGSSGDTMIVYGTQEHVERECKKWEEHGYHTVYCGNLLSEHAFTRYAAALLDSTPVDNRDLIVNGLNGYLEMANQKSGTKNFDRFKIQV